MSGSIQCTQMQFRDRGEGMSAKKLVVEDDTKDGSPTTWNYWLQCSDSGKQGNPEQSH